MSLHKITLVSLGYFDRKMLEQVAKAVQLQYGVEVSLREEHVDINKYFDAGRKQYNGNLLLRDIDQHYASDAHKTIGLLSVDLFIPILTYIFGQAYLNGRAGIASFYRLSNERYGLESDKELLTNRFSKEVIHELGHSYGLIHCLTHRCVMQSSTYVEDIDQKLPSLCHDCKKTLGLA